jgi:hypothetical protein
MLEKSVSESVVASESSLDQLSGESQKSLNRLLLSGFLHKLNGRFVGVDFVKQDGSARALNGRLGVHSRSKGGENKVATDARPYVTIFDAKADGYRTLNLATVSALRADRTVYNIVD